MTVAELIEQLSELDPNLEVYIRGYEGGLDDVVKYEHVTVCKNYNSEWYYGKHEEISQTTKSPADLSAYQMANGIVLWKG
jgi:hypothetical protein